MSERKAFFTWRVSGSPTDDPNTIYYDTINETLERNGVQVLNSRTKKKLDGLDRTKHTPEEIYKFLTDLMLQGDYLVAECTYASLGVGYEIGICQQKGIKVLCLFRLQEGRGLEAMSPVLRGAEGDKYTVQSYTTVDEVKSIITEYLTKN